MGEPKKELITKLEKISALYKNTVKIQTEMDGFVPEDHYQRKVDVPDFPLEVHNAFDRKALDVLKNDLDHTADNAIEAMGRCYDEAYHPQKPNAPVKPTYKGADTGKSQEKQRKLRLISNIGLGVAIFFLFIKHIVA